MIRLTMSNDIESVEGCSSPQTTEKGTNISE